MAIMDTILSTPVDIAALRADNKPSEALTDGAFTNLLHYAKVHWSYTASGSTGGDDLLAGTAFASPCGGIATALRRVFVNGLNIADGIYPCHRLPVDRSNLSLLRPKGKR